MLQDGASLGVFFSNKLTNIAACRFQNECNKVEIALRVEQFWSEIKLVINVTRADFVLSQSARLFTFSPSTNQSALNLKT